MATGCTIQDKVNALLVKAGEFRRAADATLLPDYRTKMLKTARELEAKASEIETTSSNG
jgi:hypothetical protein